MSSRYTVVPQEFDDYGEYHDNDPNDDCKSDPESRLYHEEPSIVSITVSRKEKPDGTIVRVKETYLSDGTSYQEETAIPRRKLVAGGATSSIAAPHHHHMNQSLPSRRAYSTQHQQSRKHSYEIFPTYFYTDNPEPFVLDRKMSLPHSRDPKTRMMCYVCCRCTLIMIALLMVACLLAWFVVGDDWSSFLEMLQHITISPKVRTDRQGP